MFYDYDSCANLYVVNYEKFNSNTYLYFCASRCELIANE